MYIIIEAWKLFAPFFHPRKSYFGFEQTPVICIRFCVFVKKGWYTVCLFARMSIKVNNSIGKLCTTVKHYNSSRFRIVIEIIVCKTILCFSCRRSSKRFEKQPLHISPSLLFVAFSALPNIPFKIFVRNQWKKRGGEKTRNRIKKKKIMKSGDIKVYSNAKGGGRGSIAKERKKKREKITGYRSKKGEKSWCHTLYR